MRGCSPAVGGGQDRILEARGAGWSVAGSSALSLIPRTGSSPVSVR
jgi:hypothetical protein